MTYKNMIYRYLDSALKERYKNLKKIQELSEENMEIMRFLEKEKKYEGKNKRGAK